MTINRISFIIVALAAALTGCGGGGGGGGTSAPTTSTVTGTLVSQANSQPLSGMVVTVQGTHLSTTSGSNGSFSISDVPTGQQTLAITDAAGDQEATVTYQITAPNDAVGTITINVEGNPPPAPPLIR